MLDAVGYRHLLRVWNYVPQINFDANGTERYWQFNSGRREALIALGRDVTGSVPAACALGSVADSPLTIYFLASRALPTLFENPRQISAFDYPPQYGPSPVFSRASMLREVSGTTLFVAGTASIVGHQTLHPGDVAAQTQETLANIDGLLAEVNRSAATARFSLGELSTKLYIRNPGDLPIIRGSCGRRWDRAPRSFTSRPTSAGGTCWWRSRRPGSNALAPVPGSCGQWRRADDLPAASGCRWAMSARIVHMPWPFKVLRDYLLPCGISGSPAFMAQSQRQEVRQLAGTRQSRWLASQGAAQVGVGV